MNVIPKIIAPPSEEPLTLEQARKHLRITPYGSPLEHADDDDIMAALTDARVWCENRTRRSFAKKTYQIALDDIPCGDLLQPYAAPLISIGGISYLDSEATLLSLDPSLFAIDDFQEPGWVMPSATNDWPETYAAVNAVKISYIAGNDAEHPIIGDCLRAIKLVMGHFFENREDTSPLKLERIPLAATNLLEPHRLFREGFV